MSRILTITVGEPTDHAQGKTVRCTFESFVASMLRNVPESDDKSVAGWVCGAAFEENYRDSKNFISRDLISLDYDHLTPADLERVLEAARGYAHLAYTTFSHTPESPRLRIWIPLSRAVDFDAFQCISRTWAAKSGIELAARESHVPAQYMFRPVVKPFTTIEVWKDLKGKPLDVEAILGEYDDWTDRTLWPHRAEGDGVHNRGQTESPLIKPGLVGAFCRAFPVSAAIERFELPYRSGSAPHRRTYSLGSRPDGCIIYDDDTKFHSHHDTDPARGQTNAYDLVRLHRYGSLDRGTDPATPIADRASSRAMVVYASELPEVRAELARDVGFTDLDSDPTWGKPDEVGRVPATSAVSGVPEAAAIHKPSTGCSDQANAKRLQRWFGEDIRSVGGEFYIWTGKYWRRDDDAVYTKFTLRLSPRIKIEAIRFAKKATEQGQISEDDAVKLDAISKWANASASKAKLDAAHAILKKSQAIDGELMNRNPDLFSCDNGTIDLSTGEMRPHARGDLLTGCTSVAYKPDAKAPRFEKFLAEVLPTPEHVAFVKRWFGYCITGHVREHKMVFHVGGGGNGKGTLMNVLNHVIGETYYDVQSQKLLALEEQGATPEIAKLMGKRVATVQETPDGLELRENLIKALTGGDALSARFLHENPFTFRPTHKLQVFTNHKPTIRGTDEGIWRRVVMLEYPFSYGTAGEVASGKAQRLKDTSLEEELKGEAEGILVWLIEGAREWYAQGLNTPAAVIRYTEEYRASQDIVGSFIADRTVPAPTGRLPISGATNALYTSYKGWCIEMGHRALGRTRFVQEILRAAPHARLAAWQQGSTPIQGFTGLQLTQKDD